MRVLSPRSGARSPPDVDVGVGALKLRVCVTAGSFHLPEWGMETCGVRRRWCVLIGCVAQWLCVVQAVCVSSCKVPHDVMGCVGKIVSPRPHARARNRIQSG